MRYVLISDATDLKKFARDYFMVQRWIQFLEKEGLQLQATIGPKAGTFSSFRIRPLTFRIIRVGRAQLGGHVRIRQFALRTYILYLLLVTAVSARQ